MIYISPTRSLIIITTILFYYSWIRILRRWAILLLLINLHSHNILVDPRRYHNIIIKHISASFRPSMWYNLFLILLFEVTFHSFQFLQSLCILKCRALAPFHMIRAASSHETVGDFTHSLTLSDLIEVFSKNLMWLFLLRAFTLIEGVQLIVNFEGRHGWGFALVAAAFVSYLLRFGDGDLMVIMFIWERRGLGFLVVDSWIEMLLGWGGWNELACGLAEELGWDLNVSE
jgi:hypothetical protein